MKKSRVEFIKEAHAQACSEWKKKIEDEFPKIFDNIYEIGNVYENESGAFYILSVIDENTLDNGGMIAFIGIDGWVSGKAIQVKDLGNITMKDFRALHDGTPWNYKKVNVDIDTLIDSHLGR